MDKLQIVPDLIWRVLNDEAVVVSPANGAYCVLNGMGSVIWQLLVKDNSLTSIEDYVVEHYEVSKEQAAADINRFIIELRERGLLMPDLQSDA